MADGRIAFAAEALVYGFQNAPTRGVHRQTQHRTTQRNPHESGRTFFWAWLADADG